MREQQSWTRNELLLASFSVLLVVLVNGAMPFLMMPTLGQAVWSMGFSQSLANGSLFDLYAHDFGMPERAAIAFGLAGVWPASLLIRVGLHAADAYAAVVALWLGLAMFSAYKLARLNGCRRSVGLLAALTWTTMPIVWAHAGYSMLSIGIALLPFYFLCAFRLFVNEPAASGRRADVARYAAAAIIAIFMDGYTFMMFACGASILLLYAFIMRQDQRRMLARLAVPTHVLSFALAYFLFFIYLGKSSFEAHPIDFFRGWGLDLAFLAIPTSDVLWLADVVEVSAERSDKQYFGDASVWRTTFALPLLLLGIASWWQARNQARLATGVLLVALFGFYMALGPSLKINATKPQSVQTNAPAQATALMPAEYGVAPTGNAWISERLPGFNVMRASYRWSALGMFAMWLLVVIWLARTEARKRSLWLSGVVAVILMNLPNLPYRIQEALDFRKMFLQIDHDMVTPLSRQIGPAETVAFVPWTNDFLANYVAPKAGFRTLNIGGDKNLQAAQAGWPADLLQAGGELDAGKAQIAANLLKQGSASVLVLPYVHMLWSPHLWPCADQTIARLSERKKNELRSIPGFICPTARREQLQPVLSALRSLPFLEVTDSPLYAIARLRPGVAVGPTQTPAPGRAIADVSFPIETREAVKQAAQLLTQGWHKPEPQHTWSHGTAQLTIPVPPRCASAPCDAVLRFTAHAASPQRPVTVLFQGASKGQRWSRKVIAVSSETAVVSLPLFATNGVQEVVISVPQATSPKALNGSADGRILGIALQRIELVASAPEQAVAAPVSVGDDADFPIHVRKAMPGAEQLFVKGWHALEAQHIWSQASAQLAIPVPPRCASASCDAVLRFAAHAASPERPVSVLFEGTSKGQRWSRRVVTVSSETVAVRLPLSSTNGVQEVSIQVPQATSPAALSGSADSRILGIALQRIELATSATEQAAAAVSPAADEASFPIQVGAAMSGARQLFGKGWHAPEAQHIWSQGTAQLTIPVPPGCASAPCHAVLRFSAHAASPQRPVTVLFEGTDKGQRWSRKVVAVSSETVAVSLPLSAANGVQEVAIQVPQATSPAALSGSADSRILGIALQRIELATSATR